MTRELSRNIAAVRAFNRFYTRKAGVLNNRYLHGRMDVTEARVLFELAHKDDLTVPVLARELDLDTGYLSRLLASFSTQGLIKKETSAKDGRKAILRITPEGREVFEAYNLRAEDNAAKLLELLSPDEQATVVTSMQVIQRLLDDEPQDHSFLLRPPSAGDYGWILQRNAQYYATLGWGEKFEALAAEVVSDFVRDFDPRWERCWIAEKDDRNIGCVFVAKESEEIAKLRMLYVEPDARGLGVGGKLVDECLKFATSAGYRRMSLWTQKVLASAQRIYQAAGFELVAEEEHDLCGPRLIGQTWEIELR